MKDEKMDAFKIDSSILKGIYIKSTVKELKDQGFNFKSSEPIVENGITVLQLREVEDNKNSIRQVVIALPLTDIDNPWIPSNTEFYQILDEPIKKRNVYNDERTRTLCSFQ